MTDTTINQVRGGRRCVLATLVMTTVLFGGCKRESVETPSSPVKPAKSIPTEPSVDAVTAIPQTYEANANDLLAMRLSADRAAEGWIRLFDGHTLFGWEIATAANFRIEDRSIIVDAGEPGLMCTSMPWKDFEMRLQYKCDANTDSGVLLRTTLQPEDPSTECYEVNIAARSDNHPTGSLVGRQKAQAELPTIQDDGWRTMEVKLLGGDVIVAIDGTVICQFTDEQPLPAGPIGLQFQEGKIAFRDIELKPIGLESLIDEQLGQWTKYPDMEGEFTEKDGAIIVDGGKTQLETKQSYGDFTLLAVYELASADTNTGIFFRCIPGDEMMGYECQVNDAVIEGNPLQPVDTGTGGIFRRQSARIVPGVVDQSNAVLLHVQGLRMAAWVNGIAVSDWYDQREINGNPRRGARTDAGTIMIQGHDPGTKATFRRFRIKP